MRQLKTKAARLKLRVQGKPHFVTTETPGLRIGYRRLADGPGSWTLAMADGNGGTWTERVGTADDFEDANGSDVLSFAQALAKARDRIRGPSVGDKPITVAEALDRYEESLIERGRDPRNAQNVRRLMPQRLAIRPIADLTSEELARFRKDTGLSAATSNRTMRPFKAALNLAAAGKINNAAWRIGLKAIPNAERPRDIEPLSDEQVFALIDAAYALDPAFGLLVQVGAETGARPSQLFRLRVRDLIGEQLIMPPSRKGSENKQMRKSIPPITAALVARLRLAAAGRGRDELLLQRDVRFADRRWYVKGYADQFAEVVEKLGAALPAGVTFAWLRSSAIVRMILDNVPVALVAARVDTGIELIQNHYAAYIERAEQAASYRGLLERPSSKAA